MTYGSTTMQVSENRYGSCKIISMHWEGEYYSMDYKSLAIESDIINDGGFIRCLLKA